jgi:ABC-type uncharacterized transport system involved in gliding motility auxiliary subunit
MDSFLDPETKTAPNLLTNFGISLRSPLAVAKAAATLPGVHTKHET